MGKQLSYPQKNDYLPDLIARDGYKCYQCNGEFKDDNHIYEHLNDDRADNRFENIGLACQSCNNKKPYDLDMQIRAREKLKQNLESNFVRARKSSAAPAAEMSAEIEINVSNYEITERYIAELIAADGFVYFSDALDCSVWLCKSQTGHGAHQSVRNYIASLTSAVGPFQIVKDENKTKIIVKKSGN